ncbi:hypothetical protein CC85DRAFT_293599 [Cutaneotrichosporon oleaginosum]|uniref:Uncharacterized protein n=1 Tax=Cutaneotrichosporon oleaginosum TaxID=879819 RepID=A0A0J0XFI7_9TREE|nr:uncharacterized protein CC85DRAFT_293599 [Cutaneotrichosporon oleaginosum]KLT39837.1 hypothetical protein CC85DRAFT_293599 [Cutaneotrichosporon oleaginosum]
MRSYSLLALLATAGPAGAAPVPDTTPSGNSTNSPPSALAPAGTIATDISASTWLYYAPDSSPFTLDLHETLEMDAHMAALRGMKATFVPASASRWLKVDVDKRTLSGAAPHPHRGTDVYVTLRALWKGQPHDSHIVVRLVPRPAGRTGAIVGGVMGGVAFLGAVAMGVWAKRRYRKEEDVHIDDTASGFWRWRYREGDEEQRSQSCSTIFLSETTDGQVSSDDSSEEAVEGSEKEDDGSERTAEEVGADDKGPEADDEGEEADNEVEEVASDSSSERTVVPRSSSSSTGSTTIVSGSASVGFESSQAFSRSSSPSTIRGPRAHSPAPYANECAFCPASAHQLHQLVTAPTQTTESNDTEGDAVDEAAAAGYTRPFLVCGKTSVHMPLAPPITLAVPRPSTAPFVRTATGIQDVPFTSGQFPAGWTVIWPSTYWRNTGPCFASYVASATDDPALQITPGDFEPRAPAARKAMPPIALPLAVQRMVVRTRRAFYPSTIVANGA